MRQHVNPLNDFALDLAQPEPALRLPIGRTAMGHLCFAGLFLYGLFHIGLAAFGVARDPVLWPAMLWTFLEGVVGVVVGAALLLPRGRLVFREHGIEENSFGLKGARRTITPYTDFKGIGFQRLQFGVIKVSTVYLLHEDRDRSVSIWQQRAGDFRSALQAYARRFNLPAALRTPEGIAVFPAEYAGAPIRQLVNMGFVKRPQSSQTAVATVAMPVWELVGGLTAVTALLTFMTTYLYFVIDDPVMKDVTTTAIAPALGLIFIVLAVMAAKEIYWPAKVRIDERKIVVTHPGAPWFSNFSRQEVALDQAIHVQDASATFGPFFLGALDVSDAEDSMRLHLNKREIDRLRGAIFAGAAGA